MLNNLSYVCTAKVSVITVAVCIHGKDFVEMHEGTTTAVLNIKFVCRNVYYQRFRN